MKIQSNVFFISVMILALITSPISFSEFAFASNHEDDSENITIELEESLSITGENVETEDTDEEKEDEIELKGILTVTGDNTFDLETEDGTETISIKNPYH